MSEGFLFLLTHAPLLLNVLLTHGALLRSLACSISPPRKGKENDCYAGRHKVLIIDIPVDVPLSSVLRLEISPF